MFRSLFLAAGIGVALTPAAALGDSQTADLLAARDDCGATDNPRLAFDLGGYSDACGSVAQPVAPTTETFTSATLKPLVPLDPSRKGKISVGVSSRESLGYGIGPQTITVTLTAKQGTKNVTLFTGSATKDAQAMLGGANYVQDFEFDLAGKTGPYKSYTLDVSVGGATLAGYLSTGGDTMVSLPVPDDAVIFPPEEEEE
jgi:hypothetical protein